jgi:hypothetical protein
VSGEVSGSFSNPPFCLTMVSQPSRDLHLPPDAYVHLATSCQEQSLEKSKDSGRLVRAKQCCFCGRRIKLGAGTSDYSLQQHMLSYECQEAQQKLIDADYDLLLLVPQPHPQTSHASLDSNKLPVLCADCSSSSYLVLHDANCLHFQLEWMDQHSKNPKPAPALLLIMASRCLATIHGTCTTRIFCTTNLHTSIPKGDPSVYVVTNAVEAHLEQARRARCVTRWSWANSFRIY